MISFLNFKDFKYYLPINQQPKFEYTVKNNNNNCVSNIVEIITLNNVLHSLNSLNNQNNVIIYRKSNEIPVKKVQIINLNSLFCTRM